MTVTKKFSFNRLQVEEFRAVLYEMTGQPPEQIEIRDLLTELGLEIRALHLQQKKSVPEIQDILEDMGIQASLRDLRNVISRPRKKS